MADGVGGARGGEAVGTRSDYTGAIVEYEFRDSASGDTVRPRVSMIRSRRGGRLVGHGAQAQRAESGDGCGFEEGRGSASKKIQTSVDPLHDVMRMPTTETELKKMPWFTAAALTIGKLCSASALVWVLCGVLGCTRLLCTCCSQSSGNLGGFLIFSAKFLHTGTRHTRTD